MTRRISTLMLAVFVSACSAPVVRGTLFDNEVRGGSDATRLALRQGEAVVVLSADPSVGDDSWPADCVRDALASEDPTIRVLPAMEFRDAMFPWFETHDVGPAIAKLKTMPELEQGIEQVSVGYIISVGGRTTASSMQEGGWSASGQGAGAYVGKHGLLLCGAGPGAAGCLGFMAWQRTSDLSAEVWDLKKGIQTAAIAAKVTGTNIMPAFVLPLPLIAPTETTACRALGYELAKFVTTGKVPESSEPEAAEE